ncbi:MAG: aminodeoxychorismate/anthranilate synthase component II [Proteobacteria bacterium]|nr:aminodeoxychorismate/anthranilate synthase component II [Pseudomonadota bacterium]
MILLIDNYDSFTYNLVQMLQVSGHEVQVFRNDQITLDRIEREGPSGLVISPGPCTPDQAGISVEAIRCFGSKIPLLGVCLGHQAIAAAFGGKIVRADRIMHGKTSLIFHDGRTIYQDLPNPFEAIRYHSLIVDGDSVPDCLEVSSWTQEGEIMGLRHRQLDVEGVQFHPESILTREGTKMLQTMFN